MAFKPLHDRVLVKRVQSEEKTKGGLIIPETAKEKPAEGEIVAVGEGARKDSGELIAPSVKTGAHIDLPEPVARHAVRVLRLPPGAAIVLFDGRGGEYEARIQRIERERVVVELGAWRDVECESRLSVTLVQALQAGDKMDFTIQKAVELGVRDVVPVDSRRSVIRLAGERAAKRVAHWQGVAAASGGFAAQSGAICGAV